VRPLFIALFATAALAVAGCGDASDNASNTQPTATTQEPARSPTDTVTTGQPVPETVTATTPPATSSSTTPTATTKTQEESTGGASGDTNQDPDCKSGTGPGQPLPQCEPVSGPDAMDNQDSTTP
jgi:hypothetical protein